MFKKIVAALIAGFLTTILLIERDPRVHSCIGRLAAENFEKLYGVHLEYKVHSINMFLPSLTLEQVVITPRDDQAWRWKAKFFSFSCSWFDLWYTRTINLHVALDEIKAESAFAHNALAIAPHIASFLQDAPLDIPLVIKSIDLRHSMLSVTDADRDMTCHLAWNSNCATVNDHFTTHVTLADGALRAGHEELVHLSGTVSCDIDIPTGLVTATADLGGISQKTPDRKHTLHASWHEKRAEMQYACNDAPVVHIHATHGDNGMMYATAQVDVPRAVHAAALDLPVPEGTCTVTAHQTPYEIRGSCTTTCAAIDSILDWSWDFSRGGTVCIRTPDNHMLARATLSANDLSSVSLRLYDYALQQGIAKYGLPLSMTGDCAVRVSKEGTTIKLDALHDQGCIRIPATYSGCTRSRVKAEFDYARRVCCIHEAATNSANGSASCINGQITFNQDGSIACAELPVQLSEFALTIAHHLFVHVSGNGTVTCDQQGTPTITGTLVINKGNITENIMSDYVRYTIEQLTAQSVGAALPGPALQYALHVYTQKPLHVHTPFINTQVMLDIKADNTTTTIPRVSGNIHVYAGQLEFPYRPLYIDKATITFVPGALTDPFIELMATNTINQYNVALQLTGTMHDPQIMLESSPSLTDEQIIALLFVGTHDSLTSVLPTVLGQKMAALLLADTTQAYGIDRYLKGVFHPLERVRLVPRFSDQTARGGLRGALEINVDDRWRALIQNNFSLTEDTRVELEYQVSDDIRVRGIRNERHDVSGEVEMRWKF